MGKQFNQNNNRGGGNRGGGNRGGYGGRGGRPGMDQGPPAFVVPYGTFLHRSQNYFLIKCTDCTRVPKFNRGVYLESKAKIGSVDQILGPTAAFYFSVKPAQGVNPDGFKPGQLFFMNPEDLLPMDRFTKKPTKGPKPAGGRSFQGGQGGRPPFQGGNRPPFQGGSRPPFKGGNRPPQGQQGGSNFNKGGHTKQIFKK